MGWKMLSVTPRYKSETGLTGTLGCASLSFSWMYQTPPHQAESSHTPPIFKERHCDSTVGISWYSTLLWE